MSITGIILRIGLVIFVVEGAIMLAGTVFPPMPWLIAPVLIDATVLTAVGAPIIYYWVLQPYARHRAEVEKAAHLMRLKSEGHLRTVLDTVVDGVIIADNRGRISVYNPAAEAIFGFPAAEVLGQSINTLMPSHEAKAHDGYLRSYQDTGQARIIGIGREVQGRRKNGEVFPMDLSISEFEVEGDLFYTGIVRDITKQKAFEADLVQARDAAERANQSKSNFMANMSHELRTPLNAIIGFSEAATNELFGPLGHDKYREYAADVQGSAEHLLEVINDILDMARIEAGRLDLHEETFDAKAAAEALQSLIDDTHITLTCSMPDDLPLLFADKRRFKQIVLNLLSNASKYTTQGGTVELGAVHKSGEGMEVRVSDTGIGMSAEDIARALEPFEQIDTGLDRRYEGSGLGLPLVSHMVEMHGGDFTIESEPGNGTTVRVLFPRERLRERNAD